jgi:D-lactate dehydrogenase (cytochrome)
MPLPTYIDDLRAIVGADSVLMQPEDKLLYEYDASFTTHAPDVVVLPRTTAQVAQVVALAAERGLPLVARGAGTGLSGGALPTSGGVLLVLTRLRGIRHIDARNRRAHVEAGVVNQHLVEAVSPFGLTYAPDPGSGKTSTIGGNIATNAGGPHCLVYGVTANHVMALNAVLVDGTVIETGSVLADSVGYDLNGVIVGSEGTLAVVTDATVQLLPKPESVRTLMVVFPTIEDGSEAVSAIIAAGIVPAALEMMDGKVCRAVEEAVHAGYPEDAGSVLLIDVEGIDAGLDAVMQQIADVCTAHKASTIRHATNAAERTRLWLGRKSALGAMGRIAPNYFLEDGVVPRHKLPEIMTFVESVAQKYDLPIGNFFHAGDGNIHPTILFDRRDEDALRRARLAAEEILERCIALGGTVSGEHGIGIEKQEFLAHLYSQDDLDAMWDLKRCFDPEGRLNPGKVFPKSYVPSPPVPTRNGHHAPLSFDQLVARVEEIVGTAAVSVAPDDLSTYALDDVMPRIAASPASVEEVSALMKLADAHNLAVVPWGGGTRKLLGNPPQRYDLALHTGRLNAVIAHYPADLTLAVQAGRTLAATNEILAAQGQHLPLDAPLPAQSTLGGIVASGPFATGLRRMAYGTVRDMLTGLQFVRADGRIVRRGGMVVKNVAGYDLARLQYGAFGTLGVITELNLKVQPLPESSLLFGAALSNFDDAAALLDKMAAAPLLPSSVLAVDGATLGHDAPIWVLVRFDGRAEANTRQLERVRSLLDAKHTEETQHWSGGDLSSIWENLVGQARLSGQDGSCTLLRLNVAAAQTVAALGVLSRDSATNGAILSVLADAANGIIWANVRSSYAAATSEISAKLITKWAQTWPQLTVATASADLKASVWGAPPAALPLMNRIKARFDPQDLLNPGRFLVQPQPERTMEHVYAAD